MNVLNATRELHKLDMENAAQKIVIQKFHDAIDCNRYCDLNIPSQQIHTV